ncbi:MAG: DUF3883 domain-containing protein [Balneolaceae bacterium]|nr:DUF3883 domain-containing protein [Balneolaceae bacterium]
MVNQVQSNSTIGIKRLSQADLGTSDTSNLTHIGLFDGTLNFLESRPQILSSQLIYQNQTIDLLAILDFIQNPDGTFRSPKIRLGHEWELNQTGVRVNSVVRAIREIAQTSQSEWYLLWFGLDTNELIFFLFNRDSQEYNDVRAITGTIETRKQISNVSTEFTQLITYLNDKVERVNLEYYQELEIVSQTSTEQITRRIIPRIRDLEKANKIFKETGRKGEQLLFQHFELQKENGFIKDFKWLNQSKESGMPYDFEITEFNNTVKFSDSKATKYMFEQPIILSSSELHFIHQNKTDYLIHRVYNLDNEPKLRVCRNISTISDIFIPNFQLFNGSLTPNRLSIKSLNIAVPTDLNNLTFENEIDLNFNK